MRETSVKVGESAIRQMREAAVAQAGSGLHLLENLLRGQPQVVLPVRGVVAVTIQVPAKIAAKAASEPGVPCSFLWHERALPEACPEDHSG
jgi:hypothetical protein